MPEAQLPPLAEREVAHHSLEQELCARKRPCVPAVPLLVVCKPLAQELASEPARGSLAEARSRHGGVHGRDDPLVGREALLRQLRALQGFGCILRCCSLFGLLRREVLIDIEGKGQLAISIHDEGRPVHPIRLLEGCQGLRGEAVRELVDPAGAEAAARRFVGDAVCCRVLDREHAAGSQEVRYAVLERALRALHDLPQRGDRERRHAHDGAEASDQLGHEAPGDEVLEAAGAVELLRAHEARIGTVAGNREAAGEEALLHDVLDPHEGTGKDIEDPCGIERHLLLPWLLGLEHHLLAVEELEEIGLCIEAAVLARGGAHELVSLVPEGDDRLGRCRIECVRHPSQLGGDRIPRPAGTGDASAVDAHERDAHDTGHDLHDEGLARGGRPYEHEGAGTGQVELVGAQGAHAHPLQACIEQVYDLLHDGILPHDRALAFCDHLVAGPRKEGIQRLLHVLVLRYGILCRYPIAHTIAYPWACSFWLHRSTSEATGMACWAPMRVAVRPAACVARCIASSRPIPDTYPAARYPI